MIQFGEDRVRVGGDDRAKHDSKYKLGSKVYNSEVDNSEVYNSEVDNSEVGDNKFRKKD